MKVFAECSQAGLLTASIEGGVVEPSCSFRESQSLHCNRLPQGAQTVRLRGCSVIHPGRLETLPRKGCATRRFPYRDSPESRL